MRVECSLDRGKACRSLFHLTQLLPRTSKGGEGRCELQSDAGGELQFKILTSEARNTSV